MLKASWIFERGGRWRVGNGESINIIGDDWLPHGSPMLYREDAFAELHLNKVADLISNGTWRHDLIEYVFSPATATCILVVPLPLQVYSDILFWSETFDGWYTSKSGYDFIRRWQYQAEASSSTVFVLPTTFWQRIWKSTTIPRCKEVVWRASSGFLPVRASLRQRGMDVDPSCPWCGIEEETTSHVLFQCPVVARFWFVALGLHVDDGGGFS
ncbi:uncharacterized protein LOC130718368 [Lotus japonicus]|uniref:uncharacterized protein LOC130718368 n=1 Tax=Lotus japonicus TaxID=34305 RepID=UPI00258EBD8A|nr:uncharacterized protein LOC130718368 [Lotus japonicus]